MINPTCTSDTEKTLESSGIAQAKNFLDYHQTKKETA